MLSRKLEYDGVRVTLSGEETRVNCYVDPVAHAHMKARLKGTGTDLKAVQREALLRFIAARRGRGKSGRKPEYQEIESGWKRQTVVLDSAVLEAVQKQADRDSVEAPLLMSNALLWAVSYVPDPLPVARLGCPVAKRDQDTIRRAAERLGVGPSDVVTALVQEFLEQKTREQESSDSQAVPEPGSGWPRMTFWLPGALAQQLKTESIRSGESGRKILAAALHAPADRIRKLSK